MKRILLAFGILFVLYGVLMVPLENDDHPATEETRVREPFVWGQDSMWYALEDIFRAVRSVECVRRADTVATLIASLDRALASIQHDGVKPSDPAFITIERSIFTLGPWVAGCPASWHDLLDRTVRMRRIVKDLSRRWDMGDPAVRERMYRLLYGARATIEEVILQMPPDVLPTTLVCDNEPSETPSTTFLGVRIHSGDILVSRGGAPTSALIARGNDFQGNFSHIALVRVDAATGVPTIIESHIERGVTLSSVEEYLGDRKLRVMVLRMRRDLPAIMADPLLPHNAAQFVYDEAKNRHVPYDFAMDATESSQWFCSEVASIAYASQGVRLWMGLSTISSTGLRRWLGGFGVRSFVTQEPSDLEYDPQLRVIAEWRDPEALLEDHMDNAVTEVMLEGAEHGDRLEVDVWKLPIARTMKLYSWVLNIFGSVGPIPEGMSAEAALRNTFYSARHEMLYRQLREMALDYRRTNGYSPPYWRMLDMIRASVRNDSRN